MKWKTFIRILLGIAAFFLLLKILSIAFVEPWIRKKIEAALSKSIKDYKIQIGNAHLLILSRGIELEDLLLYPIGQEGLRGEVASLKLKGINIRKALHHEVVIGEIAVIGCNVNGKIHSQKNKPKKPLVSPLNIRIGRIHFEKINVAVENSNNSLTYLVKDGVLNLYNTQAASHQTLSPALIGQLDFKAGEILSVSPDSLYSYSASGIIYTATTQTMMVSSFAIRPSYTGYAFTSRFSYETDCIQALFTNIQVQNFSLADFLQTGSMVSSLVDIEKMDLSAFRDKRKEFRHVNKPVFQELVYNYRGYICIDSVHLKNSSVVYTEHAEQANEPGEISFQRLNATVYNITNDTLYKSQNGYFELRGHALLMGAGRMTIVLKGKLYEPGNTFTLTGTLADMAAKDLNPMLEKNAFIYANSGKIDTMHFRFTANNAKATGTLTMLYHGLDVTVKNKHTDDTTRLKERLITIIANKRILDSNPVPGEGVRLGMIDYTRDPERFLFNYCFKSILTGLKESLVKKPREKIKQAKPQKRKANGH